MALHPGHDVVTMIPVVLVFVFLQRFITTGIAGSGLK